MRYVLVITLFIIPFYAFGSCTQTDNSVGFVGLDNPDGSIYVDVAQHDGKCQCDYIRFYASNTDTDKVLSILLTARLSNNKVRIDILEEGNCNSGNRVYMQ